MDNDFSDRATDGDINEDDIARSHGGDRASAGKIFIGGLSRDTTNAEFVKYFSKYGELTDSVIMKDRKTGHPRGFGFVTYADPLVVDQVIEGVHVINGKQVEIKRTIPKSSPNSKDFKTKRLFVGGIPTTVTEQELKDFFSNYGEVKEHQILRDHETNRSRGFGFVTFDSSDDVDNLLSKGNHIDMADTQVEIKKAEPKNSNPPPPSSRRGSRLGYGDMFDDGYGAGYVSYYRSGGQHGSRMGGGGYGGAAEFGYGGGYGGMDGYRGESSLGFPRRYGGNSFGGAGYAGGYGDGGVAGGGGGYGSGYGAPGMDGGFGAGGAAGAYYGNRAGGGGGATYGNNRYHPYGR